MDRTTTNEFSRDIDEIFTHAFGKDWRSGQDINEDAVDLLGSPELGPVLGAGRAKIAIVGTANVGKSSLINALFKDTVVLEGARSDVTNQITRLKLPSGIILYDTPGLAGLEDDNEEITRAFLGLSPYQSAPETIPMCRLDSTNGCPHKFISIQGEHKEVVLPHPSDCKDRYKCANATALIPGSNEHRGELPDVILHVFSLRSGLKRDDKTAFQTIVQEATSPVIAVGNFLDSLPSKSEQDQAIKGAKKVSSDIICLDSQSQSNLHVLITKIMESLPTAKTQAFNQQLHDKYQRSRDEVFQRYVAQIAAKAALADTTNKIERVSPDPEDPKKTKTIKLTEVDQLAEVLSLRIMIDYMFDEEAWRSGRNKEKIGELISSNRENVNALLAGGASAGALLAVLAIASATAGNLGFYAVAATVLGWFGLGGAAWMAAIAALGGPIVVIPALAVVLGAAVYGVWRWIGFGEKYGGIDAIKEIYLKAFFLRRQLMESNAGVVDEIKGDEKCTKKYIKQLNKSVKDEVDKSLEYTKDRIKKKFDVFKEDPEDPKTKRFIETEIASILSSIKPGQARKNKFRCN